MLDKILEKLFEQRLPPFFKETSHNELCFRSQNGLKTFAFQMWFFFGLIVLIPDIISFEKSDSLNIVKLFSKLAETIRGNPPQDLGAMIIYGFLCSIPPFFFIVWLFAKPNLAIFNRTQQTVHFKTSAHDLHLPFSKIKFLAQWFPTKAGGSTEFFVTADGPFGPGFFHRSPKNNRKFNNETTTLNLGTFRVDDEAEGQRYHDFFQAYMAGQGSALDLYQTLVNQHSQTNSPYAKPSWKDFF